MKNQKEFEDEYLKDVQNVSQKTKDACYSAYCIGWNENEQRRLMESINRLSRDKKESE